MPFLFAGDLSKQAFVTFVDQGEWPQSAVLMAFLPDGYQLKPMEDVDRFPENTEQGRIFWPDGELQWRCLEEGMRLVYLGEKKPVDGLDDYSRKLDGLKREMDEFFLWGIRVDRTNEWIEQQVPQRFAYPLPENSFSRGRVKLVVEKWLDNAGFARFSRYHSLKETKGGV